jgi:hypothetical protein
MLLTLVLLYGPFAAAQNKGTFQAGINYPAGPATVPSNTGYLFGGITPLEVHTGDFNGDSKPDVVMAAACSVPTSPSGSGSAGIPGCPASGYPVVVYLSNGDGTFRPGIISGGPVPALRSIAVGDFNGDGKLDIAAASDCLSAQDCSSGSMVILLGNGDGTFTGTGVSYPLGGVVSQANAITVGDLNSDGKADLVVTLACAPVVAPCQGAVSVYLGNGDGSFQAPNSYPTVGNGGIPVVIGDFNKDGKPDVLVATPDSNLVFFPGKGDGTLGNASSTPLPPYGAQAIAAGDFNGDGNLDVAVGASQFASVAFGNGDGTFQTPTAYNLNPTLPEAAESIVVADMNGDGKPDLIVGEGSAFNRTTLLLNDGSGSFTNMSSFQLGGWQSASIGVGDFNGDGKNDIVLLSGGAGDSQNQGEDGTLSVLLGNGDGTMRSARYISESTPVANTTRGLAVAAADFNGDGFQDLIYQACSNTISSSCGFTLLLADGAGGYQPPALFSAPVSGSHFLALGDFNHDGKPDVAVFNDCDASCTASSVSIFLNTGNGTFADPLVYEGGDVSPLAIATGDFNGDGKLDIAILEYCGACSDGENTIGVLLGNGDGTFQPVVTMHTGAGNTAYWLAAADFNGDGKADLVLAESTNDPSNPFEGSAQILLSTGDGTFSFGAIYDSGGGRNPYVSGMSVMTGDVNGDGKADIVIGNLCEPVVRGQLVYDVNCANGSIGVLLGNGDGTFQSGATYVTTDANLYAISLADVNGDGKLDAVGSTATGIAVFFGNGDGTFQPPTVYAALEVLQNVQLAIADLNGDGGLDIVQPSVNGQLAVLYNQGFSNPGTTVSLQSSLNPSTYGQQVNFTATVTSTSGTPTGSVSFLVDGNPAGAGTLTNGVASFQTTTLTAGTHSVAASYGGSEVFQSSNSAALSQVVNKATIGIAVIPNVSPSYVTQTVFFTAFLTPQFGGDVSGSVTFLNGATPLGTAPLLVGNRSVFAATFTTPGTRSITAVYSGDSNNLGSTSSALSQVVKALPAVTTTGLITSGTPVFIGQSVTFVATVFSTFGRIPVGELVTFSDGATVLSAVPLSVRGHATFTTSALKAATHTIKAAYAGDATFKASAGSVKQVVSLYPSSTTAPTSSLNPSIYGQSVTLTATITSTAPNIPTGTATFKNGATSLGTATLNASGVATLTKANLPAGSLSITAIYNGDSETTKSTSSVLTQTVNQAMTATALASSHNPSTQGQLVKFTATVTSPTTTPTGAVTFMDGSNVLGTVNLAGGKASYSTSALSTGSHNITGVYSGTSNITGSTSATLAQTVN